MLPKFVWNSNLLLITMKKISILLFFIVNCALGQSITIDPSTGNNGNININSTNGGIVIPRMTSAQRAAITNPTQGLLIYQTDGEVGFYVNRSSLPSIPNWSRLTEGENLWTRNFLNSNNIYSLNSGNLGVGTSSPTDKVTVQTSTNTYGVSHTDGTNTISTYLGLGAGWVGTKTASPLYFFTNGVSPQMVLNTVGNVGIGTTGPTSRLTVFTPASSTGLLHNNGTVSLATFSNTTSGGVGTTTNHPFYLFTNNTTASPAFSLLTNGNVGIGNNTPTSPLTFGSGLGSKISFTGESSGTDNGIGLVSGGDLQFYLNSSGRKFLFGTGSNSSFSKGIEINPSGFLGVNLGSTSASGRVDMGSTDGNNLVLRNLNTLVSSNENHIYYKNGNHWTARISAIGTGTTEAKLSFYTGANTSPSSLLERMTILNNGNVGIGINSPDKAGLVVNKVIGNAPAIFGDNTSGVGIEVSWPGVALNGYYNAGRKPLVNGYVGGISMDPTTGLFRIYNSSTTGTAGTNIATTDRFYIDNEGDVGIGLSNPTATLHVARGVSNNDGTAVFAGTTHPSHFNYSTAENTYIRGGKNGSKVIINDVSGLGSVQVGGANTPAGFKMSVDGKLICTEIEVLVTPWPDYVFKPSYKLKPLHEVEQFISQNGHLPNIPKAEEIENKSLPLGNMSKLQMEKIEELTLYLIEINKKLALLEKENQLLKEAIKRIKD